MTRRVKRDKQYLGTHWETNWGNLPTFVKMDPLYRFMANLNPALVEKFPEDTMVYRRCPPMKPNQTVTGRPRRGYDPCVAADANPCKNDCCSPEVHVLVWGEDDWLPPVMRKILGK